MVATKVPIKVQKRSGFDKSHHNALTQKVGTIVPILVDEVVPNTKVHLRYAFAGSLPPLAVDAYMKVYYDIRAFFVPFRLLAGGFESWFTNFPYNVISRAGSPPVNSVQQRNGYLPYFSIDPSADFTGILDAGSLSDYLGYKVDTNVWAGQADTNLVFSAMPFLAYHRVCSDWFRQPNIEREYFARPSTSSDPFMFGTSPYFAAVCPFVSPTHADCAISIGSGEGITKDNLKLADGTSIFSLRQCNYDYDYFTNAMPSAQLGSPMSVNTTGNSFTISQLRSMNSLQQFAELNQMAGSNLVDVVSARYGANLSRGVAQRCVYLGGARLDVGTRSVDSTSNGVGSVQNPLQGWLGSTGGKAYIQGTDVIIDGFTAEEPGYIFVVGMLIPKVTYGSGIRRYLLHYTAQGSITDMANPLLQNVGNQPIFDCEITGSLGFTSEQFSPFGFTDRYAEFMTMEDEVHGNMQVGQSMDSFVAQRYFVQGDMPVISSSFLKVPTSALNNVTSVVGSISQYGLYGQFAFDYKVSQPLAQYSLPSLQNPAYEHGKTVMVHRGGFRF